MKHALTLLALLLSLTACTTAPPPPVMADPQAPPYTIQLVLATPGPHSALRNQNGHLIPEKLLNDPSSDLFLFPPATIRPNGTQTIDCRAPYFYTVPTAEGASTEKSTPLGRKAELKLKNNFLYLTLTHSLTVSPSTATPSEEAPPAPLPSIKTWEFTTKLSTRPANYWAISPAIPKGAYLLIKIIPPTPAEQEAYQQTRPPEELDFLDQLENKTNR